MLGGAELRVYRASSDALVPGVRAGALIASPGLARAAFGRTYLSMDIMTWLIVGLVAGLLASLAVGGTGFGIVGDIVIGIAGAFVGGFLFRQMHWHAPFAGLAGIIFVAFIGAVVLLLLLRLIRHATTAH